MDTSPILEKLKKYCTYRERCHYEVRSKILSYKVYGEHLEKIIDQLIEEDYLNELRYARSYVRGKYRMNKWGRYSILRGLRSKSISAYCINKAMEEIDPDEYRENLEHLISRFQNRQKTPFTREELNSRTVQFLYGKGYEKELIIQALEKLSPA